MGVVYLDRYEGRAYTQYMRHPLFTMFSVVAGLVVLITLGGIILLSQMSPGPSNTNTATNISTNLITGQSPIYVSIVTHNEEPASGRYPDFTKDEEAFYAHRAAVVEFANMLYAHNLPYNWQSDWNFLLAATQYDQGDNATNGKNIVRYLHEDLGFGIGPHAHEKTHNYADVAYLIDSLGVEPLGVVGGFLASPTANSKVEYLQQLIHAQVYDYTWQAEVLWGGGSPNHVGDFNISGVWRPKDNEHFLEHDEQALPNIGPYVSTWEGVNDLLEKQEAGELETGKIYTATVMADQDGLLEPGDIQAFEQEIKDLEDETAAGRIIWTPLEHVVDIWLTQYGGQPNIFTDNTVETPARSLLNSNQQQSLCGDGVCQVLERQKGICPADC